MSDAFAQIDLLAHGGVPDRAGFTRLIEQYADEQVASYLFEKSRAGLLQNFGRGVFVRGLVEISSYCKNDCLYCGLRRSNVCARRYRLREAEILACCVHGYALGFRTFVLQGGEDAYFTDDRLEKLLLSLKAACPDAAVTLSLGERGRQSYKRLFAAGADRYLLRHEAASPSLYAYLHPGDMQLQNRLRCLHDLKEIGYQTGAGFMVGAPGQTANDLADDLVYLARLRPQMVGIGPFLPARGTPFENCPPGSGALTVFLVAVLRLLLPHANLPATTALASLPGDGRLQALDVGANVVMPNLSPPGVRGKYAIYDNKKSTGGESAEHLELLARDLQKIGRVIDFGRGDYHE